MKIKKILSVIAAVAVMSGISSVVPANGINPLSPGISASAEKNESEPKEVIAVPGVNSVMLSWDWDSYPKSGCRIFIKRPGEKKYSFYKDIKKNNHYTVKNLEPGGTYYFKIADPEKGTTKRSYGKKVSAVPKSYDSKYPWITAYRGVLKKYPESAGCSLYDLTGDGIPELIISISSSHFAPAEIYSYFAPGKVYRVRTGDYMNSDVPGEDHDFSFGSWGQIVYFPSLGLCSSSERAPTSALSG